MADQEERNALLDNEEEEESDDEMFQLVVHEGFSLSAVFQFVLVVFSVCFSKLMFRDCRLG